MIKEAKIGWHPAFQQAIKIELKEYAHLLAFESEHQLTDEPLRIDTLIIKKQPDVKIDKNIGQIFLGHNVIEYKSPEDNLNLNDYNKVFGYAYLYAALTAIPITDVTITLAVTIYPRELLKYLQNERGLTLKEVFGGIYYVLGESIPVQIIESKRLDEKDNLWLSALAPNLNAVTMAKVLTESVQLGKKPSAYLYAILKANPETMKEVEKMSGLTFEEVLDELGYVERASVDEAIRKAMLKAEAAEKAEAAATLKAEKAEAAATLKAEEAEKAEKAATLKAEEAAKLMLTYDIAPDEVSVGLGIPLERVQEIKKMLNTHNN